MRRPPRSSHLIPKPSSSAAPARGAAAPAALRALATPARTRAAALSNPSTSQSENLHAPRPLTRGRGGEGAAGGRRGGPARGRADRRAPRHLCEDAPLRRPSRHPGRLCAAVPAAACSQPRRGDVRGRHEHQQRHKDPHPAAPAPSSAGVAGTLLPRPHPLLRPHPRPPLSLHAERYLLHPSLRAQGDESKLEGNVLVAMAVQVSRGSAAAVTYRSLHMFPSRLPGVVGSRGPARAVSGLDLYLQSRRHEHDCYAAHDTGQAARCPDCRALPYQ